jgi:hypothetical protein
LERTAEVGIGFARNGTNVENTRSFRLIDFFAGRIKMGIINDSMKINVQFEALMRKFIFTVGFLGLFALSGCEQKPSPEVLGTVVEGVPKVEGADKPFEMPELGPPPSEESLPKKGPH